MNESYGYKMILYFVFGIFEVFIVFNGVLLIS